MADQITKLELEDDFRVCPACGYKDGFHTMLKKENERIKWLFICPSCHQIFDVGMTFGKETLS